MGTDATISTPEALPSTCCREKVAHNEGMEKKAALP
jgi:hypothetical protein